MASAIFNKLQAIGDAAQHALRDKALAKHRDAHVAKCQADQKPSDPKQYEDGFRCGWEDATNKDCRDDNQKCEERKREQLSKCGHDDKHIWEFEAGYRAGFREERSPQKQPPAQPQQPSQPQGGYQPPQQPQQPQPQQPQTQFSAGMDHPGSPECENNLKTYRQRHIDYHQSRGTRIEPARYDDGFRRGYTDAENQSIRDKHEKYEERKQTHIQRCGQSELVWEFEHGYKEAWECKRGGGNQPQQPQGNQECESKLVKYRDAHVQYHTSRGNHNLEVNRYEDGFRCGWKDASDGSCHDANQKISQRKGEHIKRCGDSKYVWEFEHGYQEAFKAKKEGAGGGGGGDAKYEEQLRKHREGHESYHRSRNTTIDINIFVAGFKYGWEDKRDNCANDGKRKWRQEEYAKTYCGDKNLMWEFEHGYNEGCKAKSSC